MARSVVPVGDGVSDLASAWVSRVVGTKGIHRSDARVSKGAFGAVCDHRQMTAAPRAWHFLAIAAGLAVVFVGAYLYFVHGYIGQLLDEQARHGAQLDSGAMAARSVLDAVPLASAGVVVLAVLIGLLRREVLTTVVALGVVAGANLTTQLLKHELLTRPDNGATGEWHNSFPSGHTTLLASAVYALFLVCAPRVRPVIALLGAAALVVVGALLVASQWHRPSDVVGGILVVAIFVFLGGAVLAQWNHGSVPRRGSPPSRAGLIAALVAGIAVLAVVFGVAYATVDPTTEGALASTLAGLVAIAVAAGSTAVLASRAFRRVG